MIRDEGMKAKAAFAAYCALGPTRSLAKLNERYGKNTSYIRQLEKWSSNHNWVKRAAQYDAEIAAERENKLTEQRLKMDEQHAMLGSAMTMRAIRQIEKLIEKEKFGGQASVTLFKYATDLERMARGMPNTIMQTNVSQDTVNNIRNIVSIDLSKLNNEQLEMLEQIVESVPDEGAGEQNDE